MWLPRIYFTLFLFLFIILIQTTIKLIQDLIKNPNLVLNFYRSYLKIGIKAHYGFCPASFFYSFFLIFFCIAFSSMILELDLCGLH